MLRYPGKPPNLLLTALILVALGPLLFVMADEALGQKTRGSQAIGEDPVFQEYRGVTIGLSATEVRKKLGSPRDKGDEQDFFVISDKETIQVLYDKSQLVTAISVDLLSGAKAIPTAATIFGADIEAKPNGSMYKMVRYPKAGYWVSYNRTAGATPLTSVTIQKLEQ